MAAAESQNGDDYSGRGYLSVVEVAAYTGLPVKEIHQRARTGVLPAVRAASGQYRFALADVQAMQRGGGRSDDGGGPADGGGESGGPAMDGRGEWTESVEVVKGTQHRIICGDARDLTGAVADNSIHLAITSPPYFNAKMYSAANDGDLGNVHDLDAWLAEMGQVWAEVFRVLQPGRKFFLNIMNLPVRQQKTFRTLNLAGRNIDLCEAIGFAFKRDIVWHKTNGVRAHFGTYPYPGGILINHMHEFILEFEKPPPKSGRKYAHLTAEQREASKLDKEFWLSVKNSDVWLMKPEKSGGRREHAAPFPLELPARLLQAYSFVGETALDPFAGSGTTLAAAALHQRNSIGCDINPAFCQMAQKRLRELLHPNHWKAALKCY